MRRAVLTLSVSLTLAVSLSTLVRPEAVAEPTSPVEVRASGITILRDNPGTPEQLPDELAMAAATADQLADEDPDRLAASFVDRREGAVVVVGVSSSDASRAAAQVTKAVPGVPVKTSVAKYSLKELNAIMDAVIGKQPEGLLVQSSYHDPENNRIVVDLFVESDRFFNRLAKQFPKDAIAVRIVKPQYTEPAALVTR